MLELSERKFLGFEEFLCEEGEDFTGKTVPYAVPVDEKITAAIDNPVISALLSGYINASTDISYGTMLAESIQSTPTCYPEVYEVAKKCAERLSLPMMNVYISPGIQGMNAMTIGTNEDVCIILSSMLAAILDEAQLSFVIGHEMGHIAAGHVLYHSALQSLRNTTTLIPLVGDLIYTATSYPLLSWYRRSEITADRAGLICCGDLKTAQRTMLQLAAGFMDAQAIDIDEYLEKTNNTLEKSFLRKTGELTSRHPLTVKRISAMSLFANSWKFARLGGTSPADTPLLSDAELEAKTETIVKII